MGIHSTAPAESGTNQTPKAVFLGPGEKVILVSNNAKAVEVTSSVIDGFHIYALGPETSPHPLLNARNGHEVFRSDHVSVYPQEKFTYHGIPFGVDRKSNVVYESTKPVHIETIEK